MSSTSTTTATPGSLTPQMFIERLKKCHPDLTRYGRHGGCFRIHVLLKAVFPDAEAYWDINHVITKIGDKFYDSGGEVSGKGYWPMHPGEQRRAHKWDRNAPLKWMSYFFRQVDAHLTKHASNEKIL